MGKNILLTIFTPYIFLGNGMRKHSQFANTLILFLAVNKQDVELKCHGRTANKNRVKVFNSKRITGTKLRKPCLFNSGVFQYRQHLLTWSSAPQMLEHLPSQRTTIPGILTLSYMWSTSPILHLHKLEKMDYTFDCKIRFSVRGRGDGDKTYMERGQPASGTGKWSTVASPSHCPVNRCDLREEWNFICTNKWDWLCGIRSQFCSLLSV